MVAPIRVRSPSSTAGRSASCWALLKRWISSRKRTVAAAVAAPPLARPLDHRADLRPPGVDRRLLLEGAVGHPRRDPRQRRLPRPGRPVEDRRVRPARFDRRPQRRPLADDVLLADHLVERPRPHPHRQRRVGGDLFGAFAAVRGPRRRRCRRADRSSPEYEGAAVRSPDGAAGTLESRSPTTGEVIGSVATIAPAEVQGVVDQVARIQPAWAQLTHQGPGAVHAARRRRAARRDRRDRRAAGPRAGQAAGRGLHDGAAADRRRAALGRQGGAEDPRRRAGADAPGLHARRRAATSPTSRSAWSG